MDDKYPQQPHDWAALRAIFTPAKDTLIFQLLPEIEAAFAAGVPHSVIREHLRSYGLELSKAHYENSLKRARAKARKAGCARASGDQTAYENRSDKPSDSAESTGQQKRSAGPLQAKSEMQEMRSATPAESRDGGPADSSPPADSKPPSNPAQSSGALNASSEEQAQRMPIIPERKSTKFDWTKHRDAPIRW